MNIDTQKINKGIITIEGKPVKAGMSISELERVLNEKIEGRDEYVGYVLSPILIEDEKQINLVTWFKDENVENLKLQISGFSNSDDASKYLDSWLKDRGIIEWDWFR